MDLTNCLRNTTHRQYLSWMYYLDEQWNHPDLVCHYLMRVCREVKRVLSRDPGSITDDHFKMTFTREDEKEQIPPEVKMQHSKSAWLSTVMAPFNRKKR